jgi:hypothetical protein
LRGLARAGSCCWKHALTHIAEQGCNLVEIREDPATSPQLLSNTLLTKKQSGRR